MRVFRRVVFWVVGGVALVASGFFYIGPTWAGTLTCSPERGSIVPGYDAKVEVVLNTDNDPINALSGQIIYPAALTLRRIDAGGSLISFWVEEPKMPVSESIIASTTVRFSGVIAGGVTTRRGVLFSLYFGIATSTSASPPYRVELRQVEALRGDGTGAPVKMFVNSAILSIAPSSTPAPVDIRPLNSDTTPPLPFKPIIGRSETIFDNAWFVVFLAHDKDSGLDYYEVQETSASQPSPRGWVRADSPYRLLDQSLFGNVFIRAVDKVGNNRVELVIKPTAPKRAIWGYVVGIIVVIGAILAFEIWRIRRRHKKMTQV